VKRLSDMLDSNATLRLFLYLMGVAATAGALVWQVQALREEVKDIRIEVSATAAAAQATANALGIMAKDLEGRVRQADVEHKRYDATLSDHELRLRVLEQRRAQ
jgi:hypothetical protein